MKKILFALFLVLTTAAAWAQPVRVYGQAELDALLAPVALYPDMVLSNVLVAATQPQQVQQAAAWSRANPQLSGDQAVGAAQGYGWQPAVAALVAFPDLLARMEESPQWVADLGYAYSVQGPQVMDTVQQLRMRAQASGYLRSDAQQQVYSYENRIVVQPVYPQYVVLPYYNPLVVYGSWWAPAYRPVYWRPWHARPVYYAGRPARIAAPSSRPYVRVPEAQRHPIVQSAPVRAAMPPAASFSQHSRAPHVERREAHGHGNGHGNGNSKGRNRG